MAVLGAAALAISLALGPESGARAFSIDPPPPWQVPILDGDFVGVVECVTAGVTVADYVVVEGWRGAAPGARLRIRRDTTPMGPPELSLRGELYFVSAARSLTETAQEAEWRRIERRARERLLPGLPLDEEPDAPLRTWWLVSSRLDLPDEAAANEARVRALAAVSPSARPEGLDEATRSTSDPGSEACAGPRSRRFA